MKVRTTGSTREKNIAQFPGLCKPPLGQIEVVVGDQDVAAESVDQGPAAVGADVVGEKRAEKIAKSAGESRQQQPLPA